MPEKPYSWKQKMQGAVGRISAHFVGPDDDRRYHEGVVATPLGYVYVYMEDGMTHLRVIARGVEYVRSIPRRHSKRAAALLAHRFAKEIAVYTRGATR